VQNKFAHPNTYKLGFKPIHKNRPFFRKFALEIYVELVLPTTIVTEKWKSIQIIFQTNYSNTITEIKD
jgi:hypothetical protein